jgi:outer membrane protein OmpA-like peptidoglycan-associated protein
MRRLYVVSLLLGMTALVPAAQAQNYVPQQNYNNPDVVVNMDTLGQQPNYPLRSTPTYERPLPPPVPLQPPRPMMQAPIMLHPPMPAPQRMASAPPVMPPAMAETNHIATPVPGAPMPLASAAPSPSPVIAKPAPALPPAEIVEAKPVLLPPSQDEMIAPVKPAPFEARDVAELAPPPAMPSAPLPTSVAEAKANDKKIDEPKKSGVVANKNDFAETPIVENNNGVDEVKAYKNKTDEQKKAEIVDKKKDFSEKPVTMTADEKPVAPSDANNPARTLLAQARDKAETSDTAKREVVLFDDAPKTEKPLTAPANAVPLKPTPLATTASAPKMASIAPASAPPAAMPAPMPLTPVKLAPVESTSSSSGQKVAMLKPTPIGQTPAALQAAATQVDDFEAYRLVFDGASADLKSSEQSVLDNIVKKLQNEPNTRLQLRAYANGTPDTSAQSRRVSLSRALNVRTYLVQKGITTTRLDVRALGNGSAAMGDQVGKGNIPPDRVDVIFVR